MQLQTETNMISLYKESSQSQSAAFSQLPLLVAPRESGNLTGGQGRTGKVAAGRKITRPFHHPGKENRLTRNQPQARDSHTPSPQTNKARDRETRGDHWPSEVDLKTRSAHQFTTATDVTCGKAHDVIRQWSTRRQTSA